MTLIRGYILAALLIIIAVAGGFGYKKGYNNALAEAEVAMGRHIIEDERMASAQKDRIIQLERELVSVQASVAKAYERGKRDAEAKQAIVVNDLRSGNLRLRKHWAGCEAGRVSDAAAASRELDAATRDREESAGRIVRAAAEADAQIRALQNLLRAERGYMNRRPEDEFPVDESEG